MDQHYAQEEISEAVLAIKMVEDLVKWDHEVTFVTSALSHPEGIIFPGYRY